jgi:hypothetical protein
MLAAVLSIAFSIANSNRWTDISGNWTTVAEDKWYDMSGNNFLPGLSNYSHLGVL